MLVDDDEYELMNLFKWNFDGKYAQCRIGGLHFRAHQIVMGFPENCDIDHINGNRLDNRKENLRTCSRSQNAQNAKKKQGISVFKGVSFDKRIGRSKKWVASIKTNYKKIFLGTFLFEIDAAKAYNEAAMKYHGEFARLNTI